MSGGGDSGGIAAEDDVSGPMKQSIEELERAVERLMADNQVLKLELQKRDEELRQQLPQRSPEEGGAPSGVGAELRPDGSVGPFDFPQADLPWPMEYLRVVAPGGSDQREPCGDWLSLFRNAAPYIAAFRGGAAVVHIPSSMLDGPSRAAFKGVMEDVAFCNLLGIRCVVVTSIEDRVNRRLQELGGYEERAGASTVGNGLNGVVFDEQALRIAKQEAGLARVEVESALTAGFEKRASSGTGAGAGGSSGGGGSSGNSNGTSAGIFPVRGGVSVVSSTSFFSASPMGVREGVDYGYAGRVRSVNTDSVNRCLADGDIVSLTPLGASPSGEVFFVSSEELAAIVAKKLRAIKLVYITNGQRLTDTRDNHVIAGVQLHDAKALLKNLQSEKGLTDYSQEDQQSDWFLTFVRHLRLLCEAVDPKGVRRGHLVDPTPGALLQEFYTTDGSGTVIAQDSYQGLGRAAFSDAASIRALLKEYSASQGLDPRTDPSVPTLASIEAGCASGEFFVWKRDEVVLGTGQVLALGGALRVAELRCLAVAEGQQETHVLALLGYAERVAKTGGAAVLAVPKPDPDRVRWFAANGFHEASAEEAAALPAAQRARERELLLRSLDAGAMSAAEKAIARFNEDQRMWGGTVP